MAKPDIQDAEGEENLKPDAEGVSHSAAQDGKPTAFVIHPVSANMKRRINRSGYRILDAKFAPKGATVIDGQTGKEAEGAARGSKSKRPAKKAPGTEE